MINPLLVLNRAVGKWLKLPALVLLAGHICMGSAYALDVKSDPKNPDVVTPTLNIGVEVFATRCILCHGNVGMGEGVLATTLKDYPNTNLRKNKYGMDRETLRNAVIYGGERGAMHNAMPPYGDELTWVQLESVVKYLDLFYRDVDMAVELARNVKHRAPPKRDFGRVTFQRRCVMCHGKNGDGKGKMAKIIKNPPPFDLTASRAPDAYLLELISKGGAKMGRSAKMPPFGGELSDSDIKSIILYIKSLRK